jgi:hypothetical protein
MTKQGKLLQALKDSKTLRRLDISQLTVKKISFLPMNPSIRYFRLFGVKLTRWDGPSGWLPYELETISLYQVPLKDEDLEGMLSDLSNLRDLEISGNFGSTNLSTLNVGHLTDHGCELLSRLLPDLNYQRRITKRGASVFLQNCHHLRSRSIDLADANIGASDLPELLRLSESLLL